MKTAASADRAVVALFDTLDACLMGNETPSAALRQLWERPEFARYPFSMLRALAETPQSPIHHPEGNVWNHTLRVVDEAAARRGDSADPRALMWAALLHDIGKPATTRTRRGRITAYGHDKTGARLAREFLSFVTADGDFAEKVARLVEYHMQLLYVVKDMPFQDVAGMKRRSDIREVALLALCDRLGRKGAQRAQEEEQIRLFLRLAEKTQQGGTDG